MVGLDFGNPRRRHARIADGLDLFHPRSAARRSKAEKSCSES
jgi:hypothetical protein